MRLGIIVAIQFLLLAFLLNVAGPHKASAVTAVARTSDWKLQQTNIKGVIYWSDYNAVYGTKYYTITVGL